MKGCKRILQKWFACIVTGCQIWSLVHFDCGIPFRHKEMEMTLQLKKYFFLCKLNYVGNVIQPPPPKKKTTKAKNKNKLKKKERV